MKRLLAGLLFLGAMTVSAASSKKVKKYYTHFNGARPFMVLITNDDVEIYRVDQEVPYNKDMSYSILVKSYKGVIKTFLGRDDNYSEEFSLGNTILIETSDRKYTFIGNETIYEFATNDKIQSYYSEIGNSDVPYPVAVGNKSVYFFAEDAKKISKSHFAGFEQTYSWQYDSYEYGYYKAKPNQIENTNVTEVLYLMKY